MNRKHEDMVEFKQVIRESLVEITNAEIKYILDNIVDKELRREIAEGIIKPHLKEEKERNYQRFIDKTIKKLEEEEDEGVSSIEQLTDKEGEKLFEMFGLEKDVLEKLAVLKQYSNIAGREYSELLIMLNRVIRNKDFGSYNHINKVGTKDFKLVEDKVEEDAVDYVNRVGKILKGFYDSSGSRIMSKYYYDLDTNYVYEGGNWYIDNMDSIEEIDYKEIRQDVI